MAITKHTGGNFGEIKAIQLFKQENIISLTGPDESNQAVLSVSENDIINIYFTRNTEDYKCDPKEKNGVIYYEFNLEFEIPKVRKDVFASIAQFLGEKILCKFIDKNATEYLAGNKSDFLKVMFSPNVKPNNNSMIVKIEGKLKHQPYFLVEFIPEL